MAYKAILYPFVLIILFVAFLEGIVRVWGYADRYLYDPIYTLYQHCDIPLVVHKSNLHKALARSMTLIDTDSLGLRSLHAGEVIKEKSDDEIRIAIVGDSVTFGHGVPNTADTYPAMLETNLNDNNGGNLHFRVLNFGVSAYSLAEMAATLRCRMLDVQPDIVICAFIFDDFDPNRMVAVDEYGYTNDRRLGGGAGRFPLIKRVLRNLHLTYLVRDAFIAVKTKVASQVPASTHVSKSYTHLQEFRNIAWQHGIDYCFILLPSFGSDDFSKIIGKLDEDDFQYLDLSNLWKEYELKTYRARKFDNHPSAVIHKEIAARTTAYIKDTFLARIKR